MPVGDIRPIKAGLREQYKRLRRNMPREIQDAYDETIARRVAALWQYKRCRMLLTYVSTAIEVDTRRIIGARPGRRQAGGGAPRVPAPWDMEFYLIRGLDELEPGTFGVLEPRPDPARLVKDFSSGLCLIPACAMIGMDTAWAMEKGTTTASWPISAAIWLASAIASACAASCRTGGLTARPSCW